MLHEEMMTRFQPEWTLGEAPRYPAEEPPAAKPQDPGRLAMAAAVVGNTLAGGVFLGLLLLLPAIVERLLALA